MFLLCAIESEGMVCHVNIEHLLHRLLNLHDTRVAILEHRARRQVNEVVVLFELERAFVLGAIPPKLMPCHKITIHKKLNSIVYRRLTDMKPTLSHLRL